MKTRFTTTVAEGEETVTVESTDEQRFAVRIGDGPELVLDVECVGPRRYRLLHEGRVVDVAVDGDAPRIIVHDRTGATEVVLLDEQQSARNAVSGAGVGDGGQGSVRAPMPGKVVKALVEPGQRVAVGDGVIIVEAMKMENELRSAVDGVVTRIAVAVGDAVEAGQELVAIERTAPA